MGGLRYMILYMTKDTPMNGAEMMEKMESASIGWWRPSPGSLYPMLNSMAEEGLILKRDDGKYVITQKGLDEISGWWMPHEKHSVEGAVLEMESDLLYMEELPTEKLAPYLVRVKRIGERAQKLGSRSERI
jgi:DNA-binding PadR family transcriptional regulator